ncbi:heterokaryon incompatibility protein-domain-containing protein [Diaporthe sp. PMI_573]|nr:heterokaryon incompatibility protein-domain-containing protein [Diaporthaceae sp. PMI_573]
MRSQWASDCHQCRNITFTPGSNQLGSDSGLDDFEAVIHPDVASLKACAEQRSCRLCVVLYGMFDHRSRFGPSERQSSSLRGRYPKICLSFHFGGYEESDEWDILEDERHIEDTPKDIVFSHPLGTDEICIRNPQAIARSSWVADEIDSPNSSTQTDDFEASADPNPTNNSTGSDEAVALARRWIDTCAKTHENCDKRSSSTRRIPRRLLDVTQVVDKTEGLVRLVNTAERMADGSQMLQYVTLSHRWNPTYNCFTFASNIHEHETQGIEMTRLPKTFAEACVTVKKLGLTYIWIDSLCIIQDSNTDKGLEIPNMADYYQNAELNLSASTQSIAGLWSDRDGEATKPFEIKAALELPEGRKRVVLELAPVLRADKSHLDYRGWILQERIFPRRTLFFDPYWISFECSQMSASESCPNGMDLTASSNPVTVESVMGTQLDRDCSLTIIGGIIRSVDAIGQTNGLATRRQMLTLWYQILNEYSLRQLSFESDRLDAISGLAERLSRITGDEQNTAPRLGHGRAVSCVPRQPSPGVMWQCEGPNRFGSLSEASLSVLGRPLRGLAYSGGKTPSFNEKDVTMEEDIEELPALKPYKAEAWQASRTQISVVVRGKTKSGERAEMVSQAIPDTSDQKLEGYVHLLPVAESWVVGGGDRLFCLVLKETSPGVFERIGSSLSRSCYVIKVPERKMMLV